MPDIFDCADAAGHLITGDSGRAVPAGSMFFLKGMVNGVWSHSHVGIVAEWRGGTFVTAEGNTGGEGGNDGWVAGSHVYQSQTCDFGVV